ncbi:MAG: hypothetical protein R3F46_04300 [bacterium]
MRILASLFALLAMLLPAPAGAQQPGELIPTRDPLYDRLQQAVLDEHRDDLHSGNPYWTDGGIWQWAPELASVEAWEPEFGQRCDYWELRAVVAAAVEGRWLPDPSSLRRALECTDASPAAARALMRRELRDIRADDMLSASEEDARTDELIASYTARFPEQSWVHYEAAEQLAHYLLDERWLAELEAGNALPPPGSLELYPLSFVHARMLAGEDAGNPAVAGSILAMRYVMLEDDFATLIRMNDSCQEMVTGGCAGGIERGLTALLEAELRCRADTLVPWKCCMPQVASIVPPTVLRDLRHWQGPQQPPDYGSFLADFEAYDDYWHGIHGRMHALQPQLADYLADSGQLWGALRDKELYPEQSQGADPESDLEEGIGSMLEQLTGPSMYHSYEQEYALNRWLLDNEVPRCREMLLHLASFDYEHPEEYVGMEQAR